MILQQAVERALTAWKNQREQAYCARVAAQRYSTKENSYRHKTIFKILML